MRIIPVAPLPTDRPIDRPTGVSPQSVPPNRGGASVLPHSLPSLPPRVIPPPCSLPTSPPPRHRPARRRVGSPVREAGPGHPGTGPPSPMRKGTTMARPLTTLSSVCATCGLVYERTRQSAYCLECRPAPAPIQVERRRERERRRGSATARGYGQAWRRLSARARRLQPWCSDCGRTEDLTADHSPRAWERYDSGRAVRLDDIDVVCRECNTLRGEARGGRDRMHPTMADGRRDLEALAAGLEDLEIAGADDDSMGMDERIARGLE